MARLSPAALLSLALAAGSAVAQTTTVVSSSNSPYTVPGSAIAAGDKLRVMPGGSLANQSTVTNSGMLEFASTAAGVQMSLNIPVSGTGSVIKSGNGTLYVNSGNTSFTGNWRFQDGVVVAANGFGGGGNSQQVFGGNATWTLAGGFFRALNNGDYSIGQKSIIITSDGGGIDFSQQSIASGFGTQIIEGNTGGSLLGVTGTLTLTGAYSTNTSPVVATPGMQVRGGVIAVNSDRAVAVNVSDDQVNTVAVTLNGGTLKQSATLTLPRPLVLGTNGGGLDTTTSTASATPAFTGAISGTGNRRLIANGDLTGSATGGMSLGGVNTFTGTTTVTSGAVLAQSSFGNPSNEVVLDGGALLASGGTRANAYATRIGQATGSLRAAAASDVLNQSGVVSGSGSLRGSGNGTVNL